MQCQITLSSCPDLFYHSHMVALVNQWSSEVPQADEEPLKAAFAVELLKCPTEPFRAALAVMPNNTNRALRIANEWVKDPFVIEEIERLKDEQGELAFLPNKAALGRSLWDRAHDIRTSNDDFTKMARLYAEIMDFVPKVSKVALTDPSGKHSAGVTVVASQIDEAL